MRGVFAVVVVFVLCAAGASRAQAEQARCTLDLATCVEYFGRMAERPWLGVMLDTDSTGKRTIVSVTAGSPAEKANVRPGDVLVRVGGLEPREWFASKAGWKDGDRRELAVLRGGHEKRLELECHAIPSETLARIVGEHMMEAHYAYMEPAAKEAR